jgi:hypothetical protein
MCHKIRAALVDNLFNEEMVPDTRKMLTPMASDHRRIFFQGLFVIPTPLETTTLLAPRRLFPALWRLGFAWRPGIQL